MTLFFENKNLERITYRNTLSLKGFFKDNFEKDAEYVVTWYQSKYRLDSEDNSKVVIPVTFLKISKLSKFIYNQETKKFEDISNSLVEVNIPINLLHKLPIGSIWQDGKSKYRFDLPLIELTIEPTSEDKPVSNFKTYTFYEANSAHYRLNAKNLTPTQRIEAENDAREHPRLFDMLEFLPTLKYDANNLINVLQKNRIYIIHPVSLLVGHYGYSMELKRILSAYSWQDVLKILGTEDTLNIAVDEYVPIPLHLTLRDAVILNGIKYNPFTKTIIKDLVNKINFNRSKSAKAYERVPVGFWHNQQIKMLVRGIEFSNGNVLCASIEGISEPQGNPINAVLKSERTIEANLTQDAAEVIQAQPRIIEKVIPPENIEILDVVRNPVNTLAVTALTQRFLILGQKREINKIKNQGASNDSKPTDNKILITPEPENYSVGEKRGSDKGTGLANCFLDTQVEESNRFKKLWEYGKEIDGAICSWFTYQFNFQESDNLHFMSLEEVHKLNLEPTNRPKIVFLMRVIYSLQTYYILDFEEGSGIGYKALRDEDFVDSDGNFIKIIAQVALSNGKVDLDYPSNFKSNMVLFKHSVNKRYAQERTKINWVKKMIEKLG